MDNAVFIGLIDRYIEGKATDAEKQLVEVYLRHLEEDHSVQLSPEQEEALGNLMAENLKRYVTGEDQPSVKTRTGGSVRSILRWSVAAAVVVGLLVGGDYVFNRWKDHKMQTLTARQDIQPGGNKATLTLADGRTITLDSAQNGTLAVEGAAQVQKVQNGQLAYHDTKSGGAVAATYNTISTPRGGQYQVVLPDGTKVWLDAASSLRFPTAFGEGERDVELTGQAYFEVAQNRSAAFHVKVGQMDIAVLGTHFNVNAYKDENAVRTTLLEGAVRVDDAGQSQVLSPGDQASCPQGSGAIQVTTNVDVDAVVAWKNGLFQFNDADLQSVMRQLMRWYDVDVVYEGKAPVQTFDGKLQRDLSLSQVLRILEKSQVHFRIDGRRIIVQP